MYRLHTNVAVGLALMIGTLLWGCSEAGDETQADISGEGDIVAELDLVDEDIAVADVAGEDALVSDVEVDEPDLIGLDTFTEDTATLSDTTDVVEVETCPEGLIPDCAQECVSADWLGDSFCDPVLDCALTNQDEGDCPAPIVDVEKGATSVLSWDDGESAGTHQYQETPERYYEYARFEIEQPVRIWSLQAQLAIPAASTVTFYLWDDFGGNHLNFHVEKPLSKVTIDVDPSQNGEWLTVNLPYPVELDPGRMFYAGMIVDGAGQVQLMVDSALTDHGELTVSSLVWLSEEPTDAGGFPPVATAAGDYLLRAEVEFFDEVDEHGFEAVTAEEIGMGGFSRIALEDVDGDGDIDAMLNGPSLWINDGNGFFVNETATWMPGAGGTNGGAFGDFDNDGDPDYLGAGSVDQLWRNDGGIFVNVTAESGIDDFQSFMCNGNKAEQNVPTETVSWFDANGDGWLDLYLGNFICWDDGFGARDQLWINNGDGTFTDATETMNLVEGQLKVPGKEKYYQLASRGTAPADYNGDGQMDLFVSNYRLHRNLMWENEGGVSFQNTGEENLLEGYASSFGFETYYGHTIGAVWGDVDDDGDLDVFHANLAHPRFFSFSDLATLFINDGGLSPSFSDVGADIGIRYQETPSNPNFWDYDNDGDLDLFYTCIYAARSSQFYRNDGHPAWKEVSYPTGLKVYNGWGSVTADYDMDGDLDMLASNQVFRNKNLSGNHSIFIRPKGMGAGMTNRSGYGARVMVEVDGVTRMRELAGSHGTNVQGTPYIHVGIGQATSAVASVYFPLSGVTVELGEVEAGARLVVEEDGTILSF